MTALRAALKTNPLDRKLRQRFAAAALRAGRSLASAGDFDAARTAYREALDHADAGFVPAVRVAWSLAERKAGAAAAAAKLLADAEKLPHQRLAVPFRVAAEAAGVKIKSPTPASLSKVFAELLDGDATLDELGCWPTALEPYRGEAKPYRGFKTHEKNVRKRLETVAASAKSAEELIRLGMTFRRNRWWKELRVLGERGSGRDPNDPHFWFFQGEAATGRLAPEDYIPYRAGMSYRRATTLIAAAPERYRQLSDLIDERKRELPDLNDFLKRFNFFDG